MKSDAAAFEMNDSMNVVENGNLEGAVTYPALEWSSPSEQESSSEDGDGFGSSLASSLKGHDWESRSWMEVTRNPFIPADMNVEARVPISSSGKTTVTETAKCERLFSSGTSNGDALNIWEDVAVATASEDSSVSASSNKAFLIDAEEASIKALSNSMSRIAELENGSLRKQIKLAGLLVEEKTKLRDAIQIQIEDKRANSQVHGLDYEYAKGESRSARNLIKSKRLEIDCLLSVINKAKNALAVEDVDNQINSMEHTIHHETLSLKEEKQLMHKKRQLKLLREQLIWNLGNEDEIKSALECREEAEKKLRILKKELNVLKDTVLKAEATALQAGKKYRDEDKKLRELQLQLVAANDDRQVAYSQWESLSKEFWTKNKLSLEYKNDTTVACNCVLSRNGEAPQHINKNQEYIKFKGLGTVDGDAFEHKEEQSILTNCAIERVDGMVSDTAKVECLSQVPTSELKQGADTENVKSNDKLLEEATERDNHEESANGLCEPAITYHFEELENSEEDSELTANSEVVSSEDDELEVKLKEQRQVEELAKANEARERKERQEKRIQMRKELKARKEAELKEKERERRLRKKVRKMTTGINADDDTNTNCSGTSLNSEGSAETSKGTSTVTQKRQQPQFMKQSKAKPAAIPPPLRNRNRKVFRQWMGLGLTTLFLFIVFCFVNMDVISHAKPKSAVI